MSKLTDYPFEVRPLSTEEGGGYLVSFPDFAECISDGESVEEAIENGRDALKATVAALKSKKLPVPAPNRGGVASGKFVARVPKTVHAQLAARARAEGARSMPSSSLSSHKTSAAAPTPSTGPRPANTVMRSRWMAAARPTWQAGRWRPTSPP